MGKIKITKQKCRTTRLRLRYRTETMMDMRWRWKSMRGTAPMLRLKLSNPLMGSRSMSDLQEDSRSKSSMAAGVTTAAEFTMEAAHTIVDLQLREVALYK